MTLCQYPADPDGCTASADWETDDLQEVHFLCDAHKDEALIWNDFFAERVTS